MRPAEHTHPPAISSFESDTARNEIRHYVEWLVAVRKQGWTMRSIVAQTQQQSNVATNLNAKTNLNIRIQGPPANRAIFKC
jgi:hypothetical protein